MTLIVLHEFDRYDRTLAKPGRAIYINGECIAMLCVEKTEDTDHQPYTRLELVTGKALRIMETPEQIIDDLRLAASKPARHIARVA